MAIGNLFGLVGAGIAKTVADNYKKQSTPTNTQANTPSYNTGTSQNKNTTYTTPSYNEHQQYIQDNFAGGYDDYKRIQQDRYNTAYSTGDYDLMSRLDKDAQRVGYNLNVPQQQVMKQQQPMMPQTENSQRLDDLLNALKTYQSQVPDIPYPDMSDYKFNNFENQLSSLTNELQNYKGANYMNMDEAIARANSQLSGMYNEQMNKALESYNKNAISRGMFGQMPVEALKQQAIAENELNKSNAVNALGANLHSKDFNMAQQKDNNYYAQINRLADLLGQQYNAELGKYQADVNQYTNYYNVARQQDKDYFDNIYRQLDLLGTQYNVQQDQRQNEINLLGQYSNDYMARINQVQNDNNFNNDWEIPYLTMLRNDKISGQNQAKAEANSQLNKQAMDMFTKLGYANGWVAEALGLPEGTKTASYSNQLSKNTGSGGSGIGKLTPAQAQNYLEYARDSLAKEKGKYVLNDITKKQEFVPYNPTQQEVLQQYANILNALGFDNSAISSYLFDVDLSNYLGQEIQKSVIQNDMSSGKLPGLGGSIWDLVK